jgi:hypothetical protein
VGGDVRAARTFVVLYIIEGLHESKAISSAVLGALRPVRDRRARLQGARAIASGSRA